MKRKRLSIEQIVAILKQAELRMPVADIVQQRRRGNGPWGKGRQTLRPQGQAAVEVREGLGHVGEVVA
jgi:hypothetical protein